MRPMPVWDAPGDIAKALDEGDGVWEDARWSPIFVTALSGTEYEGRKVAVAWQIEFDPFDEVFEDANAELEEMEIDPDGDGWGEYIQSIIRRGNPALAKRLHTDCESAACVIWVESEDDCRQILETVWKLIFRG